VNLRTIKVLSIALFLVTVASVGVALADSPHFIKGPTASLSATGAYTVSFKEAGLGNSPVTYTLTAITENFTFQCYTKSGNTPQGSPNSISFSHEFTSTTLTPRNGQISGGISLAPQQGTASCQGGGLDLRLIAVDYEGLTFADTTNNFQYAMPDIHASGLNIDID